MKITHNHILGSKKTNGNAISKSAAGMGNTITSSNVVFNLVQRQDPRKKKTLQKKKKKIVI